MGAIQALRHVTTEGERWDTIAWHYYGDALNYGPVIAANRAASITPTLPGGLALLIPVLSVDDASAQTATADLPPWKQ